MPQPIDLPTELARASTVERVQQAVERAALAGQQRADEEIETERAAHESEVRETHNKSEEVEQELRRRNPYRGRRRRRDASEDPEGSVEETDTGDGAEAHQLDITV